MDSEMFEEIDSSNKFSDVEPDYIHNKMLIGSYIRGNTRLAYTSGIDGRTFLHFPSNEIHQYLLENCVFRVRRRTPFTSLRLIKVEVSNTGEYNVTDKTYWIRLIQRYWRARLKYQQYNLSLLKNKYLRRRELQGHYPGCNQIKGRKLMGLFKFISFRPIDQ